jgi:hypothetical protein
MTKSKKTTYKDVCDLDRKACRYDHKKKPTVAEWKKEETVRRLHKTAKKNPKLLSEAQRKTDGSLDSTYAYVSKNEAYKKWKSKKKQK